MAAQMPHARPANDEPLTFETVSERMSALLAHNWWVLLLRGVLAVALGGLTLLMSIVSLASLVLVFAIYTLADGALGIVGAVRAAQRHERWGWLVLEGLLDIAVGIAALAWPGLTIVVFVALVASWAIVSGGTMALAALRLNKGHGRSILGCAGLLSLVWGVVLIFAPISGVVVLTLWIGAYALVFGITLVVLALRLRSQRPA